ncbi:phosphatase PAP2 family protein [Pseudomonas citronellolis]|uniref:phosphatase PAP2 family protein n=1 Tax=Pseudomonas citronellolis TaxID=53408 RepID=UPI0023E3BB14|nr:phosphatase PAP2 family protein [Pseudomonas citronellolis]MDF3937145.1 phosphatase PAP2 family protein [Pseudomonas citronellolis]
MNYHALVVATLLSSAFFAGCAGAPQMSWSRVGDSAQRAVVDPGTWAPVAGAAVIAAGNWDHKWQKSAANHEWFFGGDANQAADRMLNISTAVSVATALVASPKGLDNEETWSWRGRNLALLTVDRYAVTGLVEEWKEISGRDRPDGIPDDSFPSKHTAVTATHNQFTRRNLDYIDMDPTLRFTAKAGLYTVDGLTALSRVEGSKHYPTDTLVGMAVGNFVANFTYNLFLEGSPESAYTFGVMPEDGGMSLRVAMLF